MTADGFNLVNLYLGGLLDKHAVAIWNLRAISVFTLTSENLKPGINLNNI
jgi:hypothetical protein